VTIDKLDQKILNLLEKNSRFSLKEVADKTGVSAGTVTNRIKKLEKLKIIKNFTIIIDHRKLGYDIQAILLIATNSQKTEEIAKKITKYPEVTKICILAGGDHDIMAIVKSKNMENYYEFRQEKISQLPGVEKVKEIMVTKEII
jgi:DNA-binding Lrp family transcriptional regulator